jgi:formate dehydrogenase subunit gamma
MTTGRDWSADEVDELIAARRDLPGALLPILHAIQNRFGHVAKEAVPRIAAALNISRAEVHGVISFYHDFRSEPAGRHILKLCRAEACQSMGCDALIEHVEQRLHAGLGETTTSRNFSLEAVYCLGNCALSPAVMLDGKLHGRVDNEKIDRLIEQASRQP